MQIEKGSESMHGNVSTKAYQMPFQMKSFVQTRKNLRNFQIDDSRNGMEWNAYVVVVCNGIREINCNRAIIHMQIS